jgi:hypothetical protein
MKTATRRSYKMEIKTGKVEGPNLWQDEEVLLQ